MKVVCRVDACNLSLLVLIACFCLSVCDWLYCLELLCARFDWFACCLTNCLGCCLGLPLVWSALTSLN